MESGEAKSFHVCPLRVNIGRTGYGSPTSDGSVLQPRGIANRTIQVPPTGISATVLKNA